jgi:CheY-like chemotaxis protein
MTMTMFSTRRPCRVLLVEDHADTASVMQRLLRRWGHEVTVAHSLAEAERTALLQRFDVLLADLRLDNGTTLGLPKLLPHTRCVAITASGYPDDIRATTAAGYLHHLTKPIEAEKLRRVVELECEFRSN